MSDRIAAVNGVEICLQTFGDSSHPTLLLIMGATASMLWWPAGFCQQLAAGGRYVIRYDNRDTGRSTTYEPGKPEYSLEDLADDAIGVLAANGIRRSHFVGMSLGGMIGQIAALKHPTSVSTLTLIASSVFGPDHSSLPPIDEKIIAYHQSGVSVNWAEENKVIDYRWAAGAC